MALLKKAVFFALLLALPFISFCNDEPPPIEEFEGDTPTPIDSWLAALIVFGVIYGAHKYCSKDKLVQKVLAIRHAFSTRFTYLNFSCRSFIVGSKATFISKD